MKTLKFKTEEEWKEARMGKITGTRLKDLISRNGSRKKGFYEIIAERVAIPATDEGAMDRGKRLEDEAIERFIAETGKKVENDLIIWYREDNEQIAISPDGVIGKTEAIEVKCLNSASHIEAYLTKKVPDEYYYQTVQYFVVNDKLKTLYFVFYDPRMPKDFFFLEISRKELEKDIEECKKIEEQALSEIALIENQLTF